MGDKDQADQQREAPNVLRRREENQVPALSEGLDPWVHRSARMGCSTCMWYVQKNAAEPHTDIGRCRRHAPVMSGFPVVFPADWCGDHKLDENRA